MKSNIVPSIVIAAALVLSAAGPSFAADSNAVAPEDTKAISPKKAAELSAREKDAKAKKSKATAPVKLVDVNSASKKELMTLPGIKDAEAEKIIAGRPYLTKAHLVTHNILPQGAYESIKGLIMAKPKAEPAAKPAKK